MREETFVQIIEREANITRGQARRAARAVLRTLGQCITRGGEVEDLMERLPAKGGAKWQT
jgi:uncharacterized protein (DUF2267 family)